MAWSHTYLAGVEAVRWFIFSLILWLCLNTRLADLETRLLWGIHLGVSLASVWTAMQFLNDFPQGPNPASTFVNRNFFAEFAICALPYSVYLLMGSGSNRRAFGLAASIGLNLAALMMTGTRSALIALLFLAPVLLVLYARNQRTGDFRLESAQSSHHWVDCGDDHVLVLGLIPNENPKLIPTNLGRSTRSRGQPVEPCRWLGQMNTRRALFPFVRSCGSLPDA